MSVTASDESIVAWAAHDDTHFEKLAAAATPALVVSTDKAVAGGAYGGKRIRT